MSGGYRDVAICRVMLLWHRCSTRSMKLPRKLFLISGIFIDSANGWAFLLMKMLSLQVIMSCFVRKNLGCEKKNTIFIGMMKTSKCNIMKVESVLTKAKWRVLPEVNWMLLIWYTTEAERWECWSTWCVQIIAHCYFNKEENQLKKRWLVHQNPWSHLRSTSPTYGPLSLRPWIKFMMIHHKKAKFCGKSVWGSHKYLCLIVLENLTFGRKELRNKYELQDSCTYLAQPMEICSDCFTMFLGKVNKLVGGMNPDSPGMQNIYQWNTYNPNVHIWEQSANNFA